MKASWKIQLVVLCAGQAILMAMLAMSLPYWPLYVAELGHFTPKEIRFWSALIYISPFISAIICAPLWGKLGDRYGYKPMVIRASIGLFVTQTLIMLIPNVFWIFIFRLLQGAIAGFLVTAQAWALAISPFQERSSTMGKLQSATAVGNLFGPLMGGLIAMYFGYHSIFNASSVMCFLVVILFVFVLENPISVKHEMPEKKHRLFLSSSLSSTQKSILSILLVISLIQVASEMVTPIFTLFVTERLGGNDITVGVLYAATGFMVFLSAPFWGKFFDSLVKKNYPIHYAVAGLLLASASIQFVHAYSENVKMIFALRILWGICLGGLLPVLLRLLVDHVPKQTSGFFLGLGNSATKTGNLLGIAIGAFIEAHFGYSVSFMITAWLYVISATMFLLYKRQETSHVLTEQEEESMYSSLDV